MKISKNDATVLRTLAMHCREICESDKNMILKKRWTNLNDLKHDGPPLLLVSPEGAWKEIYTTLPVECESTLAKEWEISLRQRIYQHDIIRDDRAYDPIFNVNLNISLSDYGIPFKKSISDQADGAYHNDPALENLDSDLDKLHFREITLDLEETERNLEQANEILGDILKVSTPPTFWWTCGLTWEAIKLMGLENLMMAMYDDPEGLHRLMKFLSADMMNFITFCEEKKLLRMNTGGSLIGSGNLGYTTQLPPRESDQPALLKDLWGFAESQETVGISPDMFAEFIYPYQQPLQEKFGLNYYGCCEPVEQRWDTISKTPNLRCVSISPWCKQDKCAEQLGRDYVYCRKPNPAPVCIGFDENSIRKEFEETLHHAGSLNTMMILKDTHTIENKPERFNKWVELGRQTMGS